MYVRIRNYTSLFMQNYNIKAQLSKTESAHELCFQNCELFRFRPFRFGAILQKGAKSCTMVQ